MSDKTRNFKRIWVYEHKWMLNCFSMFIFYGHTPYIETNSIKSLVIWLIRLIQMIHQPYSLDLSKQTANIWKEHKELKIARIHCSRIYLLWFLIVACTWTKNKLSSFLSTVIASSWSCRCWDLLICSFVWIWRCSKCSGRTLRCLQLWGFSIQPLSRTSKWFEFWFILHYSVAICMLKQ